MRASSASEGILDTFRGGQAHLLAQLIPRTVKSGSRRPRAANHGGEYANLTSAYQWVDFLETKRPRKYQPRSNHVAVFCFTFVIFRVASECIRSIRFLSVIDSTDAVAPPTRRVK